MKLIFLGPPGAGKGTQAERISELFKIAHISTGDMLRREIKDGTKLGMEAKALIDAGSLVPDEVILAMVRFRIAKDDCKNGFLLDGFPRTVVQADALGEMTQLNAAIDIEVPAERLVARISGRRMCSGCGEVFHVSSYGKSTCHKCGADLYIRDDDREETVWNRIKVYQENTAPLIEYYDKRRLLERIDGDRNPDEVFAAIRKALEKRE